VENIRKRLPNELERRMLAVVRSANDSLSDISMYCERAHGFLPKQPIRREKINEILAPIWLKRFPLSEFGDSVCFDADESMSAVSEVELACTPDDIAQKLIDIECLFQKDVHIASWRTIHDQLHMLKGDLLTLSSDPSLISVLGMINLILLGRSQDPGVMMEKWLNLRDRIDAEVIQNKYQVRDKSAEKSTLTSRLRLRKRQHSSSIGFSSSFLSTDSVDTPKNKHYSRDLSSSFVSTASRESNHSC